MAELEEELKVRDAQNERILSWPRALFACFCLISLALACAVQQGGDSTHVHMYSGNVIKFVFPQLI